MKIKRTNSLLFLCISFAFMYSTATSEKRDNRRGLDTILRNKHAQDNLETDSLGRHPKKSLFISKGERRRLKKIRTQEKKERREDKRRNRKNNKEVDGYYEFKGDGITLDLNDPKYSRKSHETLVDHRIQSTPDLTWLASNLTSIWKLLHQMQREIKQIRRNSRHQVASSSTRLDNATKSKARSKNDSEPCDSHFAGDSRSCIDEKGDTCGGNGNCVCGQCHCDTPNYGIYCQCNDHTCARYGGVMCGAAGRGQCRCGSCVCRPEYKGIACECSTSTSSCESSRGELCSGRGNCVCDRCQCTDGYTGDVCEDLIYSASMCERLKPCVLCEAFGRKYPQCQDCNINVLHVEELELSQTTCVMINLGCIVKYAYSKGTSQDGITTVYVPKGMTCA